MEAFYGNWAQSSQITLMSAEIRN